MVLVRLRLLRLGLRALPEHLRKQVAALGHRARAHVAFLALGILLDEITVDFAQLRHVVVHEGLRLPGVAAQHRDVRLHGDRLAEHEDQLVLPEELVHELLSLREIVGALLGLRPLRVGRDVLGETEHELHVLHRHHAPALLGKRLREQVAVHPNRLVELLLAHADLRPPEPALHIEVENVRPWLRDRLEELVVDLPALRHHAARVVGVRHREPQRPVLALVALLALQRIHHLLHRIELAETQVALQLEHFQLGPGVGPLLLRGRDHGLGEVRQVCLHERLDESDFLRQRIVCGCGLGGRLVPVVSHGTERRHGAKNRRRERTSYGMAQFHGVKYSGKHAPRQGQNLAKMEKRRAAR